MSDAGNPLDLLKSIQLEVQRLTLRREQLVRQMADLDAEIARIAAGIGVSASPKVEEVPEISTHDRRRAGSMVAFALQSIGEHEQGITRKALRKLIYDHPEFGPKLTANPNHFYNFMKRLADRREIEEKHGLVWLGGLAPSEPPSTYDESSLFDREGGNA